HSYLASILLAKNENPQAEKEARTATQLDRGIPEAHFALGLALLKHGDRKEDAGREFRQAIGLVKSRSAPACSYFANKLLEVGVTQLAVEAAQKAAELRPNIPGVHFTLGLAHVKCKNFSKAEEPFRAAARLSPSSRNHVHLGRVLRELG